MHKLLFSIVLYLAAGAFIGCSPEEELYHITFINNSDQVFYGIPSFTHPDTSITSFSGGDYLEANTVNYINSKIGWKAEIGKISTETLIVFLIDMDTITEYDLDDIAENYRISRRYDLTIHQLDSLDWTITYP